MNSAQLQSFLFFTDDTIKHCVVCKLRPVDSLLVVPLWEGSTGLELAAVGFCEKCMELETEILIQEVDQAFQPIRRIGMVNVIDSKGRISQALKAGRTLTPMN